MKGACHMDESNIPSEEIGYANIIKSHNIYLLISCLLLGILADYLFYGKAIGISYPVFILIFYVVFFWNSRKIIKFSFNFAWALTISIFLLSSTYFIYSSDSFASINAIVVTILIISQTLLLTGNNKCEWYIADFLEDIIVGLFYRTFLHIKKPFILISKVVHKKTESGKYETLNRILIGLLISLPLIVGIVYLLASADKVFGELVSNIPNFFKNINILDLLFRIIIVLFISITSFSYIWSILNDKFKNSYSPEENKSDNHVWDSIIVTTVLILINTIYIFFVTIQFKYLFGGVSYSNLTYAQYARRGFFELILVTLINLCILLCDINFTQTANKISNCLIKILNSVLIGCTIVMLYSAHFRMSLYEKAYGYTYLRVLTQAFMVFILALLVTAIFKVYRKDIKLVKVYIIFTIIFYVAINYLNIDSVISEKNISLYSKGIKKIDVQYLDSLSYDSVPALVKLINSRDRKVAFEAENYLYLKKRELLKSSPWQSFNISKNTAKEILIKYNLIYTNLETKVKNKTAFVK